MKVVEPEVIVTGEQMDALDRVAKLAGTTGESLLRQIVCRVTKAMEEASAATDPIHGSPASNIFPIRTNLKK